MAGRWFDDHDSYDVNGSHRRIINEALASMGSSSRTGMRWEKRFG